MFKSMGRHEPNDAWDEIQPWLQCCGVKSYTDWQSKNISKDFNQIGGTGGVPHSCCITAEAESSLFLGIEKVA